MTTQSNTQIEIFEEYKARAQAIGETLGQGKFVKQLMNVEKGIKTITSAKNQISECIDWMKEDGLEISYINEFKLIVEASSEVRFYEVMNGRSNSKAASEKLENARNTLKNILA